MSERVIVTEKELPKITADAARILCELRNRMEDEHFMDDLAYWLDYTSIEMVKEDLRATCKLFDAYAHTQIGERIAKFNNKKEEVWSSLKWRDSELSDFLEQAIDSIIDLDRMRLFAAYRFTTSLRKSVNFSMYNDRLSDQLHYLQGQLSIDVDSAIAFFNFYSKGITGDY